MAKGSTRKAIEQQLTRLNSLKHDSSVPHARAALEEALASTPAVLVAAAAKIVASAELDGFEPVLCAAFDRFMQQPAKKDPGCNAKANVVRALYGISARAFDVFLRGIHHVQREPVWGGSVDTAIELRGLCGLGLVRGGYPDALIELAELLADPEAMARLAAAQAIAYSERADIGLPLLRLKARLGDVEARVTGACLAGLLALAPHASLPFVEQFLTADDVAVREAALLALGESRFAAALPLLQRASEDTLSPESRAVALMAIALMRSDAAWEYLLSVVREASDARARDAVSALATYRHEPSLRARTLSAVAERDERPLLDHAEHAFRLVDR